ncbi:DUF1499 domain-containing protein [Maritimibacter sp. 55A14]|nr:DUF1499 domain-containing protein [Maritimibacter sp. 55A14]
MPADTAQWHVAPGPETRTGKPNDYLVLPEGGDRAAPVFAMPPADLALAFDEVAMAAPRTVRLAGGPDTGLTTYVQRSRLMGYPDFVSVEARDLGDGRATLAIWSRARYGRSDFGVNAARIDRWLEALEPLAQSR